MTIKSKFLSLSIGSVVIVTIVTLIIQRNSIREQGIEMIGSEMNAILIEAESVRNSISELNEKKAFDYPKLVKELEQTSDYRHTTIYGTIPIVAAWKAIERVADEKEYTFRVVRDNPRNPKNTPDAKESEILRHLESGEAEFFEVDDDANKLTFARPIVMTQDCLFCHGDPKNSRTGDGKDILGFAMEGWDAGDVRGAFILSTSLEKVDDVVHASFRNVLGWLTPIVIVLIGITVVGVQRSVISPLNNIIQGIKGAASETTMSLSEIGTACNNLAEGATEQASSLEETSASLEEISSMAQTNLEHTNEVQKIADHALTSAQAGNDEILEMNNAMVEIKESSNQISAIIKTIDDIAFQTNILALNASVEAARAGEAGAGFAVVADEVRSLAQRAADAASSTASLIQDASQKSESGTATCERVKNRFAEITEETKSVHSIVSEVVSSSNEQSDGIRQINEAVSQIDQVTQRNASVSEETSSSVTMLEGQVEKLNQAIKALEAMNFGDKQKAGNDITFGPKRGKKRGSNAFETQSNSSDKGFFSMDDTSFTQENPQASNSRMNQWVSK